jgi:hypothetical protein
VRCQIVDERRPFEVAGGPAVQEDDARSGFPVAPDMQQFAVSGGKGQRVQGGDVGRMASLKSYCEFDKWSPSGPARMSR